MNIIERNLDKARRLIMHSLNHDRTCDIAEVYLPVWVELAYRVASIAVETNPLPISSGSNSEEAWLHRSLQNIMNLTSPWLRDSKIYCGDRDTISLVWCEASRILDGEEIDPFIYVGDKRVVTVGETHGPFPCEHKEEENDDGICGTETYNFYVTREELANCPYTSGPALLQAILGENFKGMALCCDHQPALKNEPAKV